MLRIAATTAELVEAGGRVVEVDQHRAGSGFLYAGVTGTLRGKGDEISWTPTGSQPRTCTAMH